MATTPQYPRRLDLLKRSWDGVSSLYDRKLCPRFLPWIQDTLSALVDARVPQGIVYAPCCGTGQELVMLANALPPSSPLVGQDLSEGMAALAAARARESGLQDRVQVLTGDATQPPPVAAPLAGVFSVFGLQQLQPEPQQALKSWAAALGPGGVASICFWPSHVEEEGPWFLYDKIISEKQAMLDAAPSPVSSPPPSTPPVSWESALVPSVLELPGVQLLADRQITHTIQWDSFEEFWEVMTQGGPWNARLLHLGSEYMEDVKVKLAAHYADLSTPLYHTPSARLLVFKRSNSSEARSCL